jgi:drug/metabolite transporter (DMT)-like permease
MTHAQADPVVALGQVGVAAVLFASAGVASRLAPPGISVATFGVARLLVGGVVLAAIGRSRRPAELVSWRAGGLLALAAVAMAGFQWCYFAAVADGFMMRAPPSVMNLKRTHSEAESGSHRPGGGRG